MKDQRFDECNFSKIFIANWLKTYSIVLIKRL